MTDASQNGTGVPVPLDSLRMLIGGSLVEGHEKVDVDNPGTGRVLGFVGAADRQQTNDAVAAARKSFSEWRASTHDDRGALAHVFVDALRKHEEELAELTVLEQGKPIREARADVVATRKFAEFMATITLSERQIAADADRQVTLSPHPLGTIGIIIPWNFPLYQAVFKTLEATMAGNTVVVKPAPTSPLTALYLAQLIADQVPPGVVNIIADGGSVGPILVEHPDIAKISFTGSTATGRAIMRGAASTLKRLTLELGGNDAAVVLNDVDIDMATDGLLRTSFKNAGQVCISSKRIIVESDIYDDFVAAFKDKVAGLRVGYGMDESTDIGPVQNRSQHRIALKWRDEAMRVGQVFTAPSTPPAEGYYIPPTLIEDLPADSPLLQTELFAPIRVILRADSEEQAISIANSTEYGLGASVWSSDLARAKGVASRLEAGTVWINDHGALLRSVPYGGIKASGFGLEFGAEAVQENSYEKAIHSRL
jgi:aldehyde dehydrogenase (NAD+)